MDCTVHGVTESDMTEPLWISLAIVWPNWLPLFVIWCLVCKSVWLLWPRGYPPRFCVHGIPQARILEWIVISSSRGSSQSRNQTLISCTGRQVLYHWANREAHAFIYHVIKFNILLRNRVSWVFHIEKSFHLAYTIYTISSSGPFFITSYSRLLHWTESLCATWKVACNPLQKPLPFLGNTLPKRILLPGVMVKKILGNM